MTSHVRSARALRRLVKVACPLLVLSLGLGGCFLVPGSPRRPPAESVSGPAVYVEECQTCHAAPVGGHYAESAHAGRGIRCGQCHTAGNHPDFTQPVRDAKCGGCHQAQFQQTLLSKHFASRRQRFLDGDRASRVALRRTGFIETADGVPAFVSDAAAGDLGGRLCAACHYDEHRLGLGAVRRETFCLGCHAGQAGHFTSPEPGNRCLQCHVHEGQTVNGQIVNTHRFARPGAEGGGQ